MDRSPCRRPAFLLPLALCACQAQQEAARDESKSVAGAVINGADDRLELYEHEPVGDRELLGRSVAALMWAHRVDYATPKSLRAISAEQALGLCPDERFAEQPAAAFCSATLIDKDLVLTAGHCLGGSQQEAEDRCKRLRVVFGYYYASPSELGLASADDVYACRQVVYHQHTSSDQNFADVAVLQLDRPVTANRQPVILGVDRPQAGDALVAAGNGVGLPMKVDAGGRVMEVPLDADYFVVSTDSFEGGSGGPVFNDAMALVGYQVRGEQDWQAGNGCYEARHSEQPMEQHQFAQFAIQLMCDSSWPSETLCHRSTECGDGVCAGAETNKSCPQDCPAARCGDDLCEPSERLHCAQDCSAYADVPAAWMEDPASFHWLSSPPAVQAATPKGGCSAKPLAPASPWPSLLGLALFATLVLRRAR